MTDSDKKAGTLRPDDVIRVGHHHEDGPPCCCNWDVAVAVVDQTYGADGLIVVGWHDATAPAICGVFAVDPATLIPYLGHVQADAA